jgi:ATP-dependent Zn protease
MNSKAKLAIVCALLIFVTGVLWMATTSQRSSNTLTYSQFLEKVRTGQIASVIVMGSNSGAVQTICRLKNGIAARTVLPADYRDAMVAMQDKLVNVEIQDSSSEPLHLLLNAAPFLLLLGLWIFLLIRKFPNGFGQTIARFGSTGS